VAGDAGLAGEETSGQWTLLQLVRAQAHARRGDVERRQVGTAKTAGADKRRRHLQYPIDPAIGRITADLRAVPNREPDAAIAIDGQPVRKAIGCLELSENAPVRPGTRLLVEIELRDGSGCRVDVIDRAPVRAPIDPVRDADRIEDDAQRQVGVEPVEAATIRFLAVEHRSREEPSTRIDVPVVHARARNLDSLQKLNLARV